MAAGAVAAQPPLVSVSHLSKTYATRVVDDVHLQVLPGQVHALLGGNGSGKSTLLKMVAGVVVPDPGGTITVGGAEHPSEAHSPALAAAGGLRFVHQDLALVDQLSIAENVGLASGFPRGRTGLVSARRLRERTAQALAASGLDLHPDTPAGALRPSERALVAIARALHGSRGLQGAQDDDGPLALVLDEPTASLPVDEVDRLLASMAALRDEGHALVFVSHRLSEVTAVADHVTVLRDGRVADEGPAADFDEARVVEAMTGHARAAVHHVRRPAPTGATGAPRLRATGLTGGALRGVDLEVRAGEVVGIGGLAGSGRTSLLRALFGDLPATGAVELDGRPLVLRSPRDAVRAGIALVPEDRLREAAFLDRPIWENLGAHRLLFGGAGSRLVSSGAAERRAAPGLVRRFTVRAPSTVAPLGALSGGNQQKVVMARWLSTEPRVLLLDEPSQGVDAVAREEIHRLVREAADGGAAVVVVSSDLEELEALSDRVVVLADGRVAAELTGEAVTRHAITVHMQGTTHRNGAAA
ncbi:monosaccharide ABC transporter ATP-binding protein, CUT2 family [Quadrisphaera granulorum]|uniref:Monosaccharide ABC transporter ATP-binding protein (CUT2 family) n=1 Tax=Quadrisphaera granulorum TaxID=317664 RepID=A0A316ABX2_9ACTN|nr:sugar ABC transporter ATP-binding protein [Quadrisphaera granulorum]PWJ54909.1 monosaccharide ABC transporter ATP-binding protein (CUT2 family) [Quadrisphaera granulorum]SZE95855.1 monosaccharide ABC transporter ATP-binding protein, CUT2 family [Quadrisphaera granulorum]